MNTWELGLFILLFLMMILLIIVYSELSFALKEISSICSDPSLKKYC